MARRLPAQCGEALRRRRGAGRLQPRDRGPRIRRPGRAFGIGQDDAPAHHRGTRARERGRRLFDDVRVNDVDVGDRDIAMVFQNYGLYPHMSVYDNMAFGLRRRKLARDEIDARVRRTAGLLTIERAARAPPAPALRRPAPARRARPRDRARSRGVPARRAAVEPRRAPARADARRDPQGASRGHGDRGLRHPRPGRGADDGRSHRRHERRHASSRWARPASSTIGPVNRSWPRSSARRRWDSSAARRPQRRRHDAGRRRRPARSPRPRRPA